MDYLLLKWIHVLSATILFGTGIGSAFLLFMANRKKDIGGVYFAARHVVLADFLFTAPAVAVQLATGLALAHLGGYALRQTWIAWGLGLYLFAGACWLPVVLMQLRMLDLAEAALRSGGPLPEEYWRLDRWWTLLGALAFPAVAAVFWLMIAKPG